MFFQKNQKTHTPDQSISNSNLNIFDEEIMNRLKNTKFSNPSTSNDSSKPQFQQD